MECSIYKYYRHQLWDTCNCILKKKNRYLDTLVFLFVFPSLFLWYCLIRYAKICYWYCYFHHLQVVTCIRIICPSVHLFVTLECAGFLQQVTDIFIGTPLLIYFIHACDLWPMLSIAIHMTLTFIGPRSNNMEKQTRLVFV